jgi:hypothetical protein
MPTDLRVASITAGAIELQWDNPPLSEVGLVNHYEVLRDGNLIGTSIHAYYSDPNITSGELYCYAVVAVSNSGISSEISHGVCTDIFKIVGDLDSDGDIDIDDLAIILAALNTPANRPSDPRDIDGDGWISVLDARKLRLLCTRPRCAVD